MADLDLLKSGTDLGQPAWIIEKGNTRHIFPKAKYPTRALATARLKEVLAERTAPPPEAGQAMPTVRQASQDVFGFKDYEAEGGRRMNILPYAYGKVDEAGVGVPGTGEFATPGILRPMAESLLAPGVSAEGGYPSVGETFDLAANIAAPGFNPKAATVGRHPRDVIRNAPSTEAIRATSDAAFKAAKETGVVVTPQRYDTFLEKAFQFLGDEGLDSILHPKMASVFRNMQAKQGGNYGVDVKDLQIARRQLNTVTRSTAPELADERRLAYEIQDMLDDLVVGLKRGDLTEGAENVATLGPLLRLARREWQRFRKSEAIEEIMETAQYGASGIETNLRNGIRQLLRNKRRIKGFTTAEKKLLQSAAEGDTSTKLLRLIGKMSFGTRGGSNFLGGSIGVAMFGGAGRMIGGDWVGGAAGLAAPAVGYVAQKGADAATRQAADMARAGIASGRTPMPQSASDKLRTLMLSPAVLNAIANQQGQADEGAVGGASPSLPPDMAPGMERNLGGIQALSDILRGYGDPRDPGRDADRVRRPRFPTTLRPGGA